MNGFVIRPASLTDDILSIAACLYRTDPFIYPTAFGENIHSAARAIARLMVIPESVLSIRNIYVAVDGDTVCGVLLYNKQGSVWDTAAYYDQIKDDIVSRENFEYASEHYFSPATKPPEEHHAEIIAVCTSPTRRRMGVAQQLLSRFIEDIAPCSLYLDVLADNHPAIQLYTRLGFAAVDQFPGFNAPGAPRPLCFRMLRT